VLGVLVVSNVISMLTTWIIMRFTYARQYSLSKRLFSQYLYQPYTFFLQRNSSELSKNILSEVITVVNRAFIPGMQLIAKSIVTVLILLLLLKIDPVLALVLSVMLGGAYLGIYSTVRRKLSRISKRTQENSRQQYKLAAEAFGGIKDIKLLGRENHFVKSFSYYAKQQADDEAAGNIIAHLPRYALETIAFGGVLVIILYLLITRQNMTNAMPLLALYAFASFRLMPAMQQIFTSLAFLRMSKNALKILSRDLKHDSLYTPAPYNAETTRPVAFENAVSLRNIHFSYPNATKSVVQNLNLTIPAKSTVGIVGMTGAGKTTMIDLILGLLISQQGEMWVDQELISKTNLLNWQRKIGYVPQMIFLADDSIRNNIAFGIAEADIDQQAVERAARMANIDTFITTNLDQQYDTVVGDRGVRLSGGQRQRIGIARALYHDPEVLVLDEATSSLDSVTENVILEAIKTLSHKKTIIIIAHRLTTLTECDIIHVLQDGNIISSNTYHELLKTSSVFQDMARVSS
jgi:ABC-type multidrug transport system fused ATPase/permease subunit